MQGVPRDEVAQRTGHHLLNIISFYYDKSVVVDLNAKLVKSTSVTSVYHDENEESDEEFILDSEG